MVRQQRIQRGFVFVDALVALAILATGVLVSLAFFRAEVREARATHEKWVVLLAAESEMERLRALPFEQIRVGEAQALELTLPSIQRLKEAAGLLGVREIEPGLRSATVRIQWSSSTGRPLRVELTSEFAREGGGR